MKNYFTQLFTGKTAILLQFTGLIFLNLGLLGFEMLTEDPVYVNELKTWHTQREEALKKEDGWLNVAGLFWLHEGKNTFGSGKNNDVVFPEGKSDAFLGNFILENGQVRVEINPESDVKNGSNQVNSLPIFTSEQERPVVLSHQSLRWFIIKRGDKYGVRLRDLESPALKSFKGIATYPIDSKWKVEARLEPAVDGKTISITDVLGQTSQQKSPGTLVFKIKNKEYRLDAVESGNKLFIIFADKTNEKETYHTGRFLYTDKPDALGKIILDFNKAINPPCAFTNFATCPLPPKQNKLTLSVKAGEKRYENH
jgi:hypothetical protein